VCMETNVGEFCMELLPESAPGTVANFLDYVQSGDYTNSMIHRSEPNFVIQGGGFVLTQTSLDQVPVRAPIANEYNQPNLRGTVAMARVGSNANSATSQWFINLRDNTTLDTRPEGGFTVFARIIKGMDVVDGIAALTRFNIVDWGSAFANTPSTASTVAEFAIPDSLIRVVHAYETDRNPLLQSYQCSLASPNDTLTEFCGSSVMFPVLVDGVLYEATMNYVPGRDGLVFAVDRSKLHVIADTGQARATFNAGVLTIPSVRNGPRAFDGVQLNLTSSDPLEFTVTTYTPR